MKHWVTLSDAGHRIIRAEREPDNAVRGPYSSHDEALDALTYEERQEARGATALGLLMLGWIALGIIWAGWLVIEAAV